MHIFKALKDLFIDGYRFVSIPAPLLATTYWAAKFFEVDLKVIDLKVFSYAWTLLPLLIWVSIAYFHRRSKTSSYDEKIDLELQQLHSDGLALNASGIAEWYKNLHERISKILPGTIHKIDTSANFADGDLAAKKSLVLSSLSDIISDYQRGKYGN